MPIRPTTILAAATLSRAIGLGLMLECTAITSGAAVKDQVSNPSLWNGQPTFNHMMIPPTSDRIDYSFFHGDGGILQTIGFILDIRDGSGNPNGGINDGFGFHFGYYPDSSDIPTDQLRLTSNIPGPSNPGWQTIIGFSADGSALRYVEVDVSALGLHTTAGSLEALYLNAYGYVLGGNQYRIAYSTGGGIGTETDLYRSRVSGSPFEVRTFDGWGMVHDMGAYYISTDFTPAECPGDITGDGKTSVADFNVLASHFAQSVTPNTNGDLSGNGFVSVADFNILAGDFACGF